MHSDKSNLLNCDCKSDDRAFVILSKSFSGSNSDLLECATRFGWEYFPELEAILIHVGSNQHWSGIAEVVNFLRGVFRQETRFEELRAAWVDPNRPLAEQMLSLIHAEPLLGMAPADSSPLADILRERRIETWFQPVIEARTGDIWGFECLMRGRTREGELISAPQMLEWARQEHLTFMLDRVCRETHLENAGRHGAGTSYRFLINFLPTAIYQPEFCLQTSLAAARRSGLTPRRIIFEVVETEKVTDAEQLRNILEFYRKAGFGVALDDVGSGYAGLTLLGDLRPDLIKLDRELVTKAVESKFHRDICAALATLVRENGRLVLAEGIETPDEKAVMDALGIDLYQGYLFGRPCPTLEAPEAPTAIPKREGMPTSSTISS